MLRLLLAQTFCSLKCQGRGVSQPLGHPEGPGPWRSETEVQRWAQPSTGKTCQCTVLFRVWPAKKCALSQGPRLCLLHLQAWLPGFSRHQRWHQAASLLQTQVKAILTFSPSCRPPQGPPASSNCRPAHFTLILFQGWLVVLLRPTRGI